MSKRKQPKTLAQHVRMTPQDLRTLRVALEVAECESVISKHAVQRITAKLDALEALLPSKPTPG